MGNYIWIWHIYMYVYIYTYRHIICRLLDGSDLGWRYSDDEDAFGVGGRVNEAKSYCSARPPSCTCPLQASAALHPTGTGATSVSPARQPCTTVPSQLNGLLHAAIVFFAGAVGRMTEAGAISATS